MKIQPLAEMLDRLDRHPPSYTVHPERKQTLLDIGRFLETNIRAGQPYDLKTVQPNPLWELFEGRLCAALDRIRQDRAAPGVMRVHQWYSSGVILDKELSALLAVAALLPAIMSVLDFKGFSEGGGLPITGLSACWPQRFSSSHSQRASAYCALASLVNSPKYGFSFVMPSARPVT